MKELLTSYANYNLWANDLLTSVIEKNISDNQLDLTIISSFDSLRKTVYHLWDAENIWYRRWTEQKIDGWPSKDFTGNLSECRIQLMENSALLKNFVLDSPEEKLKETFAFTLMNGNKGQSTYWQSFHHIFNHSTFHRGQIITMLRQLNVTSLPSTDYITFSRL